MRLNKFIAQATGMSRRAADSAISQGRVRVNGKNAQTGQAVTDNDTATLDNSPIASAVNTVTILLNKPVGYVCSRDGQGSKTIYDLLPTELHRLKPAGRLDKDSSGLLLMTTDGQLAYELTHPKFQKTKIYKIALNKPLAAEHQSQIEQGILIEDGLSKLHLEQISKTDFINWKVTIHEGRNRQIRHTFEELGYSVVKLHRTHFGAYILSTLKIGEFTAMEGRKSI